MEIKKVSCVGVGLIGQSWATQFAAKGYSVILYDMKVDILKKALGNIKDNLRFLEEKNIIKENDTEKALGRIETKTSISKAVEDVDYVQESVYERYEVKKAVFKEMDAFAPEHTVLASSTSGLLMSEIQEATARPERCIVAHPWNPPHLMPLVELVPGKDTSQETVRVTYQFMLKIGKVPVVVKKEVPGFIGNRLQVAVWREALDLVDKGVASVEDVDKALCAGPGIRWAIMGSNLTLHLGGGPGGLEYLIKHLGPAWSVYWRDMASWTSIPYSAAIKAIEGVKEMSTVREKTMKELIKWRDDKLIKLLKILYE